MKPFTLRDWVAESNRIEFIDEVKEHELDAHLAFLALDAITVADLERFVSEIGGGALRESPGMNVRIGTHYPPAGGEPIRRELQEILAAMKAGPHASHAIHRRYEKLHPFMDGNGRSGRVLWLWQMGGIGKNPLGFLHSYYYQSLEAAR